MPPVSLKVSGNRTTFLPGNNFIYLLQQDCRRQIKSYNFEGRKAAFTCLKLLLKIFTPLTIISLLSRLPEVQGEPSLHQPDLFLLQLEGHRQRPDHKDDPRMDHDRETLHSLQVS